MTNPPREWPTVAMNARDRAAESACEGIRMLEIFTTERPLGETERTRRILVALNCLQRIARLLEGVGAPTRAS